MLNLRKEVLNNINYSLKDILQNFTYVGAANRTWSIIQYKTELYVCNNELVLWVHFRIQTYLSLPFRYDLFVLFCSRSEMFYQIMLLNFGNFGTIKFTVSQSTATYLGAQILLASYSGFRIRYRYQS